MDFESAVAFLKAFDSYEDKGFPAYIEKNFSLNRLRKFLRKYEGGFGKLKCVHVTGSKGKGSVCGMIGDYLWKAGYKVGVFTSPYIVDITECIWIDGVNISKKDFVEKVSELKDFIADYNGPIPTYFEFLTAVALKCFVEKGVDFAIIEVGVGGRMDATNVINTEVAVITPIEKEHTDLLGKTYENILDEKLGIVIGKGVGNLIVGFQNSYVKKIIKKKVAGVKNACFVRGNHNEAIVFDALKMLLGEVDNDLFTRVVSEFKMIGRFDIKVVNGKVVVFDIAHTKNSIKLLLKNLFHEFPAKMPIFLVSIMKNKNAKDILSPICKIAEKVVVTASNTERGYSAHELGDIAKNSGYLIEAVEDCEIAYEKLLKKMGINNILVVTGSHFLVGKILKRFFPSS